MTPWTVGCQAPLSRGFPRQEYWRGLPFPSPGHLPHPGIEPESLAMQADSLSLSHLGSLALSLFWDWIEILHWDALLPPWIWMGGHVMQSQTILVSGIGMYLIKILFAYTVASMSYEWLEHQSRRQTASWQLALLLLFPSGAALIAVSLP